MNERYPGIRVLVRHFFRRFFDNDTVQADGDTQATVTRALSIVAAPGLMISFFAVSGHSQPQGWGAVGIHYFFVLFSFVVMGGTAIFEWEMLFPDRLDFLVLSPLPLKPRQLLAAKALALVGFLALFLVSCNLFATLILPAGNTSAFFRQVFAHGVAVLSAGVFAALLFVALGSVMLCVLDASQFRVVSPFVQTLSVMTLVLLTTQLEQYSLLRGPLGAARWVPTFWFLGVYERLMYGDTAPAFARVMAQYAVRGTAALTAIVLLTYPLAWARAQRMAMEGATRKRRESSRWLALLIHKIVRRPGERAVFHFIGQTLRRNNRYQAYLAMYCGTGLALAVAFSIVMRVKAGGISIGLSDAGMHAVMPMLVFWIVSGLRAAFAFPVNLQAGWIFRVTGVRVSECAAAARRWVLSCVLGVVACVLIGLCAAHWDRRQVMVQAVCGVAMSFLLIDGFFFSQWAVPFNRPRMPGRTSLPLMLTLYIGVFPLLLGRVVVMELWMEKSLLRVLWIAFAAVALRGVMNALRRWLGDEVEPAEGYEGEFVLLGLS
jgi:hypothetical protein